jgi:FMN phosphatase YigB (HAD superfamily)
MIGDDAEADVVGAMAAGLMGVLVQIPPRPRDLSSPSANVDAREPESRGLNYEATQQREAPSTF